MYLIDGDIVSGLLEAGSVVVAVSYYNAHLMQDHSAYQLVGALHLNHNGLNVGGGLSEIERQREREREEKVML